MHHRPMPLDTIINFGGGIKSREASLNLNGIFLRVDAMPMRMREMRASD